MKLPSALLLLVVLSACGSNSPLIRTEAAAATTYIAFTGETDGLTMIIDEGEAVDLGQVEGVDENGKRVTRFGISPGAHELLIRRGDTVEIHQKIYVSEGKAVEVHL